MVTRRPLWAVRLSPRDIFSAVQMHDPLPADEQLVALILAFHLTPLLMSRIYGTVFYLGRPTPRNAMMFRWISLAPPPRICMTV